MRRLTLAGSLAGRVNQPVSIRHRRHDPAIAHGWVRFANEWLRTSCGLNFAPDEYELLPVGSPVTCITCLVKAATG
jgi:hypothetical protein